MVGAGFRRRPAWAVGSFWAPEISQDRGRFFVYYVGRKRDGPLCVAVATSARPQGPYADHGPLVCQEVGSIDPFPVTDENGQRYLLWKEDGTVIADARGRYFLLYHAYQPKDFVYVGRQTLLDEVVWGADGWPTINNGHGPSMRAASPFGARDTKAGYSFFDDFNTATLRP